MGAKVSFREQTYPKGVKPPAVPPQGKEKRSVGFPRSVRLGGLLCGAAA